EIRMDHVSHDWARSNDRHLDHDVVEVCGAQSRQTRHLRTTFDLKHSDRVGTLQCIVNGWIVLRQVRQINFFTVRVANQLDRVFQYRHHPESEQVDLDETEVRAVFFVPLDNHAPGHGGRLERHDRV